jgi:hypothetical protein
LDFAAFTFLEALTFDSSISFVFKGFTADAPNKVSRLSEIKIFADRILQKKPPLQISQRVAPENQETVSLETICRFTNRDIKSSGPLFSNLRFAHRKRRPRFPRASAGRHTVDCYHLTKPKVTAQIPLGNIGSGCSIMARGVGMRTQMNRALERREHQVMASLKTQQGFLLQWRVTRKHSRAGGEFWRNIV